MRQTAIKTGKPFAQTFVTPFLGQYQMTSRAPLQRPAGWCTESGDGQVATGHELCSTYRQQHAEV